MSAVHTEAGPADDVGLSPVQRLERSRARMRGVLTGSAQGQHGASPAGDAAGSSWLEQLESVPGLGAAFESVL